jgi:hypothetical protein
MAPIWRLLKLLHQLLLPLAALLFLLPLNPALSSLPALAWLLLQLLLATPQRRWALWPLAFALLVMLRSWLLNEMPHPVAGEDALLLVCSLLAATSLGAKSWDWLPKLWLLPLPLLLLRLGPKPWTPNPLAGPNQGGYLLGLLLLVAVAWVWQGGGRLWQRLLAGVAVALALLLVWQTGSRAALLSGLLALALVLLRERWRQGTAWRDGLIVFGLGLLALAAKQLLRPSSSGLPGFHPSSDLGRVAIAECYARLPFSGSNRLLYGVGFERPMQFCHQLINGGVADHAHNIYLQLWADTGLLGLLGLLLLVLLLLHSWQRVEMQLQPFPRRLGQAALIYTALQGCFDVSLLHWPVTQVFTGVLLAIPLAASASAQGPHGGEARVEDLGG